jgi:murein L,D-transpeptidase YcbB/YkuD
MSKINRHLPPTDASSKATSDPLDIVREYCKLAVRQNLSDFEAERLTQILKQAESDGWLDFWINEADHFLAHELNLTGNQSIYACENQQAKLREYLDYETDSEMDAELFQELKQRLQNSSKELQQHLKSRGFDPGPIDGILGPRTHSAIVSFQKAHKLVADGIPDATTRDALGLS